MLGFIAAHAMSVLGHLGLIEVGTILEWPVALAFVREGVRWTSFTGFLIGPRIIIRLLGSGIGSRRGLVSKPFTGFLIGLLTPAHLIFI